MPALTNGDGQDAAGDEIAVRDVIDAEHNTYAAIAERSVVIGYDELIGAVTITGTAATPGAGAVTTRLRPARRDRARAGSRGHLGVWSIAPARVARIGEDVADRAHTFDGRPDRVGTPSAVGVCAIDFSDSPA